MPARRKLVGVRNGNARRRASRVDDGVGCFCNSTIGIERTHGKIGFEELFAVRKIGSAFARVLIVEAIVVPIATGSSLPFGGLALSLGIDEADAAHASQETVLKIDQTFAAEDRS